MGPMRYFLLENDRGKRFTIPVDGDAICPYLGHFQYKILGVIDDLPQVTEREETEEERTIRDEIQNIELQLDELYDQMVAFKDDEEMKSIVQMKMRRLLAERERLTKRLLVKLEEGAQERQHALQEELKKVTPQPVTPDMFEACVGYGKFFLKPKAGGLEVLKGKEALAERRKYE